MERFGDCRALQRAAGEGKRQEKPKELDTTELLIQMLWLTPLFSFLPLFPVQPDIHSAEQMIVRRHNNPNRSLSTQIFLLERIQPRHGLTENQRVHIVRALVRVHTLEIRHMTHRAVLGKNAIRAE